MKRALTTLEIFVFYGWGFSNQFDMVSETHFSYNAVLPCPEGDVNIRIGKQGYVFILTDFKK